MVSRTRTIGRSSEVIDPPPCTKPVTTSFVCRMPEDEIERSPVDRQPAVRTRRDSPQYGLERQVDIDGRQPVARHHQLFRGAKAEPQRAVQPDLLFGLQQASVPAFRDEELDFLRRVDVTVTSRRDSQQPENQEPAAVQKTDRPGEERCDHSIGRTVAMATLVGSCSARDFGTSSPRIIARAVSDHQDGDGRRRFSGL